MVNSEELLGTTEHVTQQARCRINHVVTISPLYWNKYSCDTFWYSHILGIQERLIHYAHYVDHTSTLWAPVHAVRNTLTKYELGYHHRTTEHHFGRCSLIRHARAIMLAIFSVSPIFVILQD